MEHLPFWKLSFPEEEWFVGKFFRYPLRAEPPSPGSWNDWHKLTACPANLSEFNICWHEEQISPAASGFSSGLRFDVHYRNSSVALRYSCPGAACCNPTAQLVEKFMWLFALCFSAVTGFVWGALLVRQRQTVHGLLRRAVPNLLISGLWPACSYGSDLPLRHGRMCSKAC